MARPEQAPPYDDRRLTEDGRLRRHQRRAGSCLRFRRRAEGSGDVREYRLTYRTGDIVSPRIDAAEPLSAQLQDFCEAVMFGTTPRSSAEVGLQVVQMIEAADRSHASGGANVALDAFDPLSLVQRHAFAREAGAG